MDEELKIKLMALVRPESILPNLRLSKPSQVRQKDILKDDIKQNDPSTEADGEKPPDESTTEPPPKKKRIPMNFYPCSDIDSKYRGMRSRELRNHIQGDKVIKFCQENGLVAREVTCSCGNQMHLKCRCGGDGFWWVCYRSCHGSKQNKTIRKGTWFEKSNLSISDILWIAYMWVHEYSYVSLLHECDHSVHTLVAWCTCCLDMCRKIVERKNDIIGGEGKPVEIFHCEISEDKRPIGQWAFCAVEQNSTKSLHIVIDDKKSCTLLQIFQRYIRPGTKVVASNWSLFKNLSQEDFEYLAKEKSILFMVLATNERMDTFEVFKMSAKRPSNQDEWSKLKYDQHFFEKMYRKSLAFAPDAFLAFLKDIATIHKPCDKYCTCLIEVVDYKSISMKSQKCKIKHDVNKKLQ